MNNYPLVSFCIATYKRPEFIKKTIKLILSQNYNNFEIVISEDDSEKISENVVSSFKSSKIIYHKNRKHLGMTKSYNKAISLSKGNFIVLLADDDPPTNNMIEIFLKTYKKYPNAKAFWGGSYVNITTKKIEKSTGIKIGQHSLINKNKKRGSTEILKPKDFFRMFFRQEIFPHYQWTTAIISRDLINKINGVPDYNSAHFIDYAYLLKIASKNNYVIINEELGSFTLHKGSYGKRVNTLSEYITGVIEFNKIIYPMAKNFGLQKDYKKFITSYVIMYLVARLEFYKAHNLSVDKLTLIKVYKKISKKIPFFKKRGNEIFVKIYFYNLYIFLNYIRKVYGQFKGMVIK